MKLLFALFLVLSFQLAQAQMVTAWFTKMNDTDLPSDYTQATIPSMLLPKKHSLTLLLPASLDNATDSLAIVAIGNAVQDSIETNYLVPDFRIDTSLDSEGQILITDIERRFDAFEPGDKANQYGVANPVFKVWVTFRWRKDP